MNVRRSRRITFKMRLALVVPQFAFPLTGGVGPHARKLAEAFAQNGDHVLIVSDCDIERTAAYDVASVGKTWSLAAALRAAQAVRAFAPDAVLFEYTTFNFGGKSFAPLAIALLLRIARIRQAAYIHEIFYPASSPAVRTTLRAIVFGVRDAAFVLATRRFFVANEPKRARLLRIARFVAPACVTVVPIGANIEPDAGKGWNLQTSDPQTILSFGVIMPRRRFELIIEAVALLVERGRDLRLRLVGNVFDRQYAERCLDLAKARGIAMRTILTGPLADADVSAEFRNASLYAYALEDGLISSSGTLLAALVHGMPIVAAATPGDESSLREPVCVTDADPQSFAAGLERLLDDPAERTRLGSAAASAYAARFGWPAIAASLRAALL
jgi:glycosyltransferase involved in cell wall biosynthesis